PDSNLSRTAPTVLSSIPTSAAMRRFDHSGCRRRNHSAHLRFCSLVRWRRRTFSVTMCSSFSSSDENRRTTRGKSLIPSSWQIWYRWWPSRMFPSSSYSIGTRTPRLAMSALSAAYSSAGSGSKNWNIGCTAVVMPSPLLRDAPGVGVARPQCALAARQTAVVASLLLLRLTFSPRAAVLRHRVRAGAACCVLCGSATRTGTRRPSDWWWTRMRRIVRSATATAARRLLSSRALLPVALSCPDPLVLAVDRQARRAHLLPAGLVAFGGGDGAARRQFPPRMRPPSDQD